jgi:DNA polymerase-3 subunit delta
MKLKPAQLASHLNRQGLAFLYFLTGEELLQMMECADTLRNFARSQGFTERIVLTVDKGFDWNTLDQHANTLSLFATKRLIELHLGEKSPGNEGTQALLAYLNHPPVHTVLLITAGKLDAKQQKTKWFTALEERGIIIQIWPIDISQLPEWIAQRLAKYGLQASSEAINVLVERSEGHLLACAQEIEKLQLLYGSGRLDTTQVLNAVADSARFEIFDWVDTTLAGEVPRCVRQLQGLRAEGYEPVLITWALTREIRNLCQITAVLHSGQSPEQVFKTFRVWQQRKNVVTRAMKRHPPGVWQKFLLTTAQLDRIIKGVDRGNFWDELLRLSLQVAGVKLLLDE